MTLFPKHMTKSHNH